MFNNCLTFIFNVTKAVEEYPLIGVIVLLFFHVNVLSNLPLNIKRNSESLFVC